MPGREKLLRDWRERLARSEAELAGVSPYRRWIKRIYIRVYRFLLAVYGGRDWESDATKSEAGETTTAEGEGGRESHMELVDLREDDEGAPPKNAARIRKTLDTVHAAGDSAAELGPRADGLRADDWIVAASRRDGIALDRLAAVFARAGVTFRRRRMGRDVVIEVRYVDERKAFQVLREVRDRVRETPQRRLARCRRIGVVVGACTGLCVAGVIPLFVFVLADEAFRLKWSSHLPVLMTVAALGGFLLGANLGGLLDEFSVRRK